MRAAIDKSSESLSQLPFNCLSETVMGSVHCEGMEQKSFRSLPPPHALGRILATLNNRGRKVGLLHLCVWLKGCKGPPLATG